MNTVVVYTSKYGSTEKYAQWIAEALGCKAKKLSELSSKSLSAFDTIIYGGGIYAGAIAGFKKFLSKLGSNDNKTLALYIVGLTDPQKQDAYTEIADKNIPPEWKNRFKVFAFRGDQRFSRMSTMHKLMMRVPKSMAEKKPPEQRTEDDRMFIENFGKDVLLSDKGFILPLVDYIKSAE
ncbi:MAG: flavodoxin [Clostridiaceae bacterium]|jgi:menaquinone-dependent protoporphyrinogen IX oxidase|nr:flavodoxin [Clostridiaceae bacterium]